MSIYERDRCNREPTPSDDARYCRECLCKPCRWLDGKPAEIPPVVPGDALADRLVDVFNCADGYWFSRHDVDTILRALAANGLSIVAAQERKVLEACAALKISTDAIGPVSLNGKPQICSSTQAVAAAEFARRGTR